VSVEARRASRGAESPRQRIATDKRRASMLLIVRQFRAVVQAMHQHYRYVEQKCGVSGAHVWALAEIAAAPGIKVSDLARALAVHQSTASNLVDKLEQAGFLLRQRRREDWRVVRLSVTAAGKRLLDRAPRPLPGPLQDALLHLPASRLSALETDLAALLRKMHASAGARATLLAEIIK
jgi:MarR family transcriptional regulator, organic hydroperoxide resistance regulator